MNVIKVSLCHSKLFFVLICLFAFVPTLAADNGDSARAYRQGYNLVLDEDWKGAVAAFDDLVERYPASEWVDDAAFWRCYASQQLGEPSAEVFACYETLLEDHPDSEWYDDVGRAMVRLAGQLDREGRPEYREKVSDFGHGADTNRQLEVLVALGDIGDERSVDVILQRIDGTQDEHLRARIVEILDDVESPRAFEKLKDLLRTDPSPRVRMAAVESLSDHDSPEVAPLLKEVVKDSSQHDHVRVEALDELVDHEAEGLVHFLKEIALGENDLLAMEAIDELGDDAAGEEAVRVLVEVLGKVAHADRRAEILDSLEDTGLDSAVAALLQVARTDPDPRMRRTATESLGDMETVAAREALIELLEEIDN